MGCHRCRVAELGGTCWGGHGHPMVLGLCKFRLLTELSSMLGTDTGAWGEVGERQGLTPSTRDCSLADVPVGMPGLLVTRPRVGDVQEGTGASGPAGGPG